MNRKLCLALAVASLHASFSFAEAVQPLIVQGSTLTLRQCIEIALANDPGIKSMQYTAQAQHDLTRQQRAAYLPALSASATYLSNHAIHQNVTDPAANNFLTYDGKTAGLSFNQLIFDFGKTPAAIHAAAATADSAKFDVENEAVTVVNTVKQAYHGLVLAKLALRLSDEIVEQYRRNLNYAKAHYQAKIRPKYDVTKAEADLSSAVLDRIKALNNVLLAKAYLNNTMNLVNPPDYSVQESTEFVRYHVEFDKVVNTAYMRNPQLLSYMAQARALESQLSVARRDLFPALKGSAGYNFGGSVSPISQGWNAGLSVSADIFSGLRKSAKISEQENRLASIRYSIESLKLQIFLSAKQAFLNLQEAQQAYATATDQVRQATENLDISNLRYKTGIGSPVELSDATVMYNTAKKSLLNSIYDYRTSMANLEKVMGFKQ